MRVPAPRTQFLLMITLSQMIESSIVQLSWISVLSQIMLLLIVTFWPMQQLAPMTLYSMTLFSRNSELLPITVESEMRQVR